MSFFLSAAAFCFIACHAGPADHFSTFAQALAQRGYTVRVYGNGPALKMFQERHITVLPFSLEERSVLQIAKTCDAQTVIITDVGDLFDLTLHQQLASLAPRSLRLAYYDNPESYVPGGYSSVAAQVMCAAQGVLFANAHLASQPLYEAPERPIALPLVQRVGIGYYPLAPAEKLGQRRRAERQKARAALFAKYGLIDQGQKLLVYVGGNNEEYYAKALPAFLRILDEAGSRMQAIVLFQQHPGACAQNRDAALIEQAGLRLSDLSSDEVQVAADAILYYQTSMAPRFALAGIPTIQVGHAVYDDLLVRLGLCAVATDADSFLAALNRKSSDSESSYEVIRRGLGIYTEWPNRLEQSVDHFLTALRLNAQAF